MKPNDIATSIAGFSPVDAGNITASVNFTYSIPFGQQARTMDDSKTYD